MKKLRFLVQPLIAGLVFGSAGCVHPFSSSPVDSPEVVAVRNASDVAMTAPGLAPDTVAVGNQLDVGKELQWIDGRVYLDWERTEAAAVVPFSRDPLFADVFVGADPTAGRSVTYEVGGTTLGTVYWVDARVALVPAPAGSPVSVLELPLDQATALKLETKLQSLKINPGPVDGVIDTKTREAINDYLETRGVPYRFATPVINSALLRELTGSP